MAGIERGQHHEIEDVERDVEHDEQHLQREELDGAVLVAQPSERDGLKGVESHAGRHHAHILRMGGITHGRGDGGEERQHDGHEQQGHAAHHSECGAIDRLRVFPFLVGKAEQCGFHAEGEQHHDQGHVGINVGHDAVASAFHTHLRSVEGHEQVVQEPADDAAKSINGGVFRHRFQSGHIVVCLIMGFMR